LRESPIQKLAKQEAWEDLQKVMKELGLPMPAKGTHPPGYRPPPEPTPADAEVPSVTPSVAFPPSVGVASEQRRADQEVALSLREDSARAT
jgi:hypothetical protein